MPAYSSGTPAEIARLDPAPVRTVVPRDFWRKRRCANVQKIAEEAINMLMDAIENPDEHQFHQITVEGTLIEGETVAPI